MRVQQGLIVTGGSGDRTFFFFLQQGAVWWEQGQLFLDDLVRVFRQIVNDSFDTNFDAAGRLRGIEITEFEKKSSSGFDDFLRGRIGWLIHAAFIARQAEDARNPWEAGGELCPPQDFVRVTAVGGSPHVGDIERGPDFSRPDFLAEEPIQQILMNGKILQPENRIAVRLKVPFDFVPDSRVHMIGTPQHQDARLSLPGAPSEDFPGFVAHLLIERAQLPVSGFHGALRFRKVEVQNVLHTIVNLLGDHVRLGHAHERGRVSNAVFGENIAFFHESGFDIFRAGHHASATQSFRNMSAKKRRQGVDHGAQNNLKFLLLAEYQFSVVAAYGLHRIAAIHRAPSLSELPALLLGTIRAEHDIFGADSEVTQKSYPELMGAPNVQDLGNPDADPGAVLRRRRRRDGRLLSEPCLQYWDRHSWSSRFLP